LAHDRWLLAHAARVLTASQWTRRFYRRWVPEEKLQTIPNWTPVPCRLPERCPSQPPVFVSLSAWQKHKGLADLITATAMLHQQRPEAAFQVHLYGLGREGQHLRRLVAQLGVQHRVCFMGRTDNPPAVYQAATALVLPSHIEAFGMVLIEAMAAACPVIASRVGGPAEIVTHGQEGLLFNVGDATGLAACMAQILDDAAGAARLGVAGYHTARQRYNGDATLREMTALWMEL
jgi:glycosyltransferase involved in cell wall biosynthesis